MGICSNPSFSVKKEGRKTFFQTVDKPGLAEISINPGAKAIAFAPDLLKKKVIRFFCPYIFPIYFCPYFSITLSILSVGFKYSEIE